MESRISRQISTGTGTGCSIAFVCGDVSSPARDGQSRNENNAMDEGGGEGPPSNRTFGRRFAEFREGQENGVLLLKGTRQNNPLLFVGILNVHQSGEKLFYRIPEILKLMRRCVVLAALILFLPEASVAQLSPGPLSEAHSAFEGPCNASDVTLSDWDARNSSVYRVTWILPTG